MILHGLKMRRKIPSTSGLIAFEVAARQGSFAKAASELALTESAISRQISRLEEFLGKPLFERVGNKVLLTSSGADYACKVGEILQRLERDSMNFMSADPSDTVLDIAVLPSFSIYWLIPRLADFYKKYPNVTLNISQQMTPVSFETSGFDAAIHYDNPTWLDVHKVNFLQEVLIPVCHPSLVKNTTGDIAKKLDDLPRFLRQQNPDAWRDYCIENEISITNPNLGIYYDLHSMQIEAALNALGVALVPYVYVKKYLETGALVAPWPKGKSIAKKFCLFYSDRANHKNNVIRLFSDWLLNQK